MNIEWIYQLRRTIDNIIRYSMQYDLVFVWTDLNWVFLMINLMKNVISLRHVFLSCGITQIMIYFHYRCSILEKLKNTLGISVTV